MSRVQVGQLWKTDGTVSTVKAADGKRFKLAQMQELVGGMIEIVPRSMPLAYCNEEGLLKKLPYNHEASKVFQIPLLGDILQLRWVEEP